jgi:large subunit ribosomal protein L4
MKLPVKDASGNEVRKVDVDETVFGIEPNGAVLHQAFVASRANQRQGNASTKTRGEVAGSTRKIRRQKYTGRSRQGSIRAPTRVGGGIVFGPKPRDYSQSLNKKMRRLAIRSALSGKVADGQLVIIDELSFETPKTKKMLEALRNNGIERSALVVIASADKKVQASAANLPGTKVLPAAYLNVVDMMNHGGMLITEEAIRVAEGLWGKSSNAAGVTIKPKVAKPKPKLESGPSRAARAAAAAGTIAMETPAAEEKPKRSGKKVEASTEADVEVAETTATEEALVEAPEAEAVAVDVEAPAAEAKPKRAAKKVDDAPQAEAKDAKPKASARKAPAKVKTDKPAADAEEKPKRRTKKTEGEGDA